MGVNLYLTVHILDIRHNFFFVDVDVFKLTIFSKDIWEMTAVLDYAKLKLC